MGAYIYSPSTQKLRQNDSEFKANKNYPKRFYLKTKGTRKQPFSRAAIGEERDVGRSKKKEVRAVFYAYIIQTPLHSLVLWSF